VAVVSLGDAVAELAIVGGALAAPAPGAVKPRDASSTTSTQSPLDGVNVRVPVVVNVPIDVAMPVLGANHQALA